MLNKVCTAKQEAILRWLLLAGDITPSHALHKVLENKILAQLIFDVFQIKYLYLNNIYT